MQFQREINEMLDRNVNPNNKQSMRSWQTTMRRPEEVQFRTHDEQKATDDLQKNALKRDSSLEAKVTLDHFEFIGMIGQGSYGRVFLAKKKKGGKYYAIKVLQKHKIMLEKKQHEVFRERQALIMLDHPNIVKMYWSFDVR